MKIRKINKTHIVTAIILSATFLFVGCGIGTTTSKRTIEPDTVEEEISNNKDLIKENDIKEEIQNKNITNRNDVTDNQESSSVKIDIYDYILAEYSDMVQNDFYTNLRDSDAYESSFGKDIGLEIRTHKQWNLLLQVEKMVYRILLFPLGIMIYMVMMELMWFIFFQKWSLDTERISRFMKME